MTELFNKTGQAIKDMSNDLDKMEEKYGKKWTKQKRKNLVIVAQFFDTMSEQLQFHRQMYRLLRIENKALKIMMYKREMDLPWAKALKVNGLSSENAEMLEILDTDINKLLDDSDQDRDQG